MDAQESEKAEATSPAEPPSTPAPSRRRKIAFVLVYLIFLGVFSEVAARVGYYVVSGFDPYYLWFGFVADTEFHSYEQDGYSKFQPDSAKHQKVGDRVVEMAINAHGFRRNGASDPWGEDAAAVDVRIATLGASSTFGYYVEDDESYPAQLEHSLRAALAPRSVEVYNLGVPHLRIENIVELARHELPAIRPSIVTLYCGYNNVGQPDREAAGKAFRLKDWLHFHSMLYRAVRPVLKTVYFSLVSRTNRDPAGLEHLSLPVALDRAEIETLRREIGEDFTNHLDELRVLIESMDARLILVTQNYNLKMRSGSGLDDQWRTYDEEVRVVESMLEEDGGLTAVQASLLVHRDLMEIVRATGVAHGLPVVEGIAALADDPSQMHSGVHLTAEGNRRIAAAIHAAILAEIEAADVPGLGEPTAD